MIFISPLETGSTPQVFPLPGGQSGSLNIYLRFVAAPSAGTVSIEYIRPGSTVWTFLQGCQNASITGGALTGRIDGGVSSLRVTFAGLVGGTLPAIGVSADQTAAPPSELLTDGGYGPSKRIRVDVAQTSFFSGKEFRIFREFNIAAAATLVLKFVVPINVILQQQGVELDSGSLRITNSVGGTPGGTFSETFSVIGKNNMSDRPAPFYLPQVVVTAGGTITGATPLDIHRVVAATATAQQSTVGNVVGDERGIAANTYHVSYENFGNGAATGTLFFIWEERPPIT